MGPLRPPRPSFFLIFVACSAGCGDPSASTGSDPSPPAAALAAPEPATPPVDPEATLRDAAAQRLDLAWQAAGTLAAVEADLPADLADALPDGGEGPGGKASPVAVAAGRASATRRTLKDATARPMMAGSQPELTAALNSALDALSTSAGEYETMSAALSRRGVSLAGRSRATARARRQEGVDALRTAIPAAFMARVEGAYEVDADGTVWRCDAGEWREAATERRRGKCATAGP